MLKSKSKDTQRLDRLQKVMSIQSKSYKLTRMNRFLRDELNDMRGVTFHFHKGNIYVTKGSAETYPCIVAHTDTVHTIIDDFQVMTINDDIMYAMNGKTGEQTGIGGDDKVGIFVALEMLRNHDVMKVAFFKDEEVGCKGSSVSNRKFFENVEFVFQCDRKGYDDFVRKISNKWLHDDEFADKIAPIMDKFGKKEELQGGTTDVGQLHTRGVKVCMANISCGYYRPHRSGEVISIEEVFLTTDFVNELVLTLQGKVWVNSDYDKSSFKSHNHYKTYKAPNYLKQEWCQKTLKWVDKGKGFRFDRELKMFVNSSKHPPKWEDPEYVYNRHLQSYVKKSFLENKVWNGKAYVEKTEVQTQAYACTKCEGNVVLDYIPFINSLICPECDRMYDHP